MKLSKIIPWFKQHLTRMYWQFRAKYWLWTWGRWLKYVYSLQPTDALLLITRCKWQVTQKNYSEEYRNAFLDALELTEKTIRETANKPKQQLN